MRIINKNFYYRLVSGLFFLALFLFISRTAEGDASPPARVLGNSMTITALGEWGTGYYTEIAVSGNYAFCAASRAGMDILDISNTSKPVKVSNYIASALVSGIAVSGNYAIVCNEYGLDVVNISNPANPVRKSVVRTNSSPMGIYLKGNLAYVADSYRGLYIGDISNLPTIRETGSCATASSAISVFVSGNYAYVADYSQGLAVIDVSNPANPALVRQYTTAGYAYGIYVADNTAYLPCWYWGLSIFDVSNPPNPTVLTHYFYNPYPRTPVDVKVVGNNAFVANQKYGFMVLNVRTPANPVFLSQTQTEGEVSRLEVKNNNAYLADKYGGLRIYDVSNTRAPSLSGYYNQSSYFECIKVAGNRAYLLDGRRGVQVFNISTPSNPKPLGYSSIDAWGRGMDVSGDYAYMISTNRLSVVDIRNSSNPSIVGNLDLKNSLNDIVVKGTNAFLADSAGFSVVDISSPTKPRLLGNTSLSISSGMPLRLDVKGNYAYVTNGTSGLFVIDVSDTSNPTTVASFDPGSGNANNVAVSGSYAYMSYDYDGLYIVNISDPTHPSLVGHYAGLAWDVEVSGNYAFLATGLGSQVLVLDVTAPTAPALVGSYTLPGGVYGVDVAGNYIYLAGGDNGKFKILQFEEPGVPGIAFNRDALYFTGNQGGDCTGPQTFAISNNGTGTLSWSASAAESWLSCSPISGTGGGRVTVSVNPTGLGIGTYTGTITVTGPDAVNSPQEVTVNLKVRGTQSGAGPFGEFATPVDGTTVYGSVPFTGWALDEMGVESVKIKVEWNGSLLYVGDAVFAEGARDDVGAANPGFPLAYRAGWGYMMLTHFLPGGDATYTFHAEATNLEGKRVTLDTRTITVDNGNSSKPFGTIDFPPQGGFVSGNSYGHMGWALTPSPGTIPLDGSTIQVFIDGIPRGNPVYNQYREDVATLFPNYNNTPGAMATLDLDTTGFEDGAHVMAWLVTDDQGNSEGLGSRTFTIDNSGDNGRSTGARLQRYRRYFSLPQGMRMRDIPVSAQSSITVNTGVGENTRTARDRTVNPLNSGLFRLETRELERLQIDLSGDGNVVAGFMAVGNTLRPLPVGSVLDTGTNTFYWTPAPGYVGLYRLVFIRAPQGGNERLGNPAGSYTKQVVEVNINPRFSRAK